MNSRIQHTRNPFNPAIHLVWWLLLLLAFGNFPAMAQQPVGELELEKGRIKITGPDRDRIIVRTKLRVPVFQGEVLHSARDTRAQLYLREGKDIVQVYSNTLLDINEVSGENTSFGLGIGKALFKVFSRFRLGKFNVTTPTATMGVKGTEFVAATDGSKTFLLTISGTVGLANIQFPEREVIVRENQASAVQAQAPPAPPVEVPQDAQDTITTQEGTQEFEALPIQLPPPEEPTPQEGEGEGEGEGEATAEGEPEAPPEEEPPTEQEVLEAVVEVAETVQSTTETVEQTASEVQPSGDVGTTISPTRIDLSR